MRIKTLVALYFWILEFDDVTCIRSIPKPVYITQCCSVCVTGVELKRLLNLNNRKVTGKKHLRGKDLLL